MVVQGVPLNQVPVQKVDVKLDQYRLPAMSPRVSKVADKIPETHINEKGNLDIKIG
jgi:hypothetical protein